ncbi:transposase-like protein [Azospirillum soli]|nr:transposase-like protein [Azospirillum soli]
MRLLEDPEWSGWSDREIARRCGVVHAFVNKLRKEFTVHGEQPDEPQSRTYTNRHGSTSTMNVGNIGKTKRE